MLHLTEEGKGNGNGGNNTFDVLTAFGVEVLMARENAVEAEIIEEITIDEVQEERWDYVPVRESLKEMDKCQSKQIMISATNVCEDKAVTRLDANVNIVEKSEYCYAMGVGEAHTSSPCSLDHIRVHEWEELDQQAHDTSSDGKQVGLACTMLDTTIILNNIPDRVRSTQTNADSSVNSSFDEISVEQANIDGTCQQKGSSGPQEKIRSVHKSPIRAVNATMNNGFKATSATVDDSDNRSESRRFEDDDYCEQNRTSDAIYLLSGSSVESICSSCKMHQNQSGSNGFRRTITSISVKESIALHPEFRPYPSVKGHKRKICPICEKARKENMSTLPKDVLHKIDNLCLTCYHNQCNHDNKRPDSCEQYILHLDEDELVSSEHQFIENEYTCFTLTDVKTAAKNECLHGIDDVSSYIDRNGDNINENHRDLKKRRDSIESFNTEEVSSTEASSASNNESTTDLTHFEYNGSEVHSMKLNRDDITPEQESYDETNIKNVNNLKREEFSVSLSDYDSFTLVDEDPVSQSDCEICLRSDEAEGFVLEAVGGINTDVLTRNENEPISNGAELLSHDLNSFSSDQINASHVSPACLMAPLNTEIVSINRENGDLVSCNSTAELTKDIECANDTDPQKQETLSNHRSISKSTLILEDNYFNNNAESQLDPALITSNTAVEVVEHDYENVFSNDEDTAPLEKNDLVYRCKELSSKSSKRTNFNHHVESGEDTDKEVEKIMLLVEKNQLEADAVQKIDVKNIPIFQELQSNSEDEADMEVQTILSLAKNSDGVKIGAMNYEYSSSSDERKVDNLIQPDRQSAVQISKQIQKPRHVLTYSTPNIDRNVSNTSQMQNEQPVSNHMIMETDAPGRRLEEIEVTSIDTPVTVAYDRGHITTKETQGHSCKSVFPNQVLVKSPIAPSEQQTVETAPSKSSNIIKGTLSDKPHLQLLEVDDLDKSPDSEDGTKTAKITSGPPQGETNETSNDNVLNHVHRCDENPDGSSPMVNSTLFRSVKLFSLYQQHSTIKNKTTISIASTRRQNIDIQMKSSGEVPLDSNINDYLSFEAFKLKL